MEANKVNKIISISIVFIGFLFLYNCKKEKEILPRNEKSYNQKSQYKHIIEDSLIYDFLNNGLLKENELYKNCNYILSYRLVDIEDMDGAKTLIPQIDSIFTKEDLTFIRKQYENGIHFKIDSLQIKDKIVMSRDIYNHLYYEDIYNEIPKNYPCILIIEAPLFNIKRNMTVISIKYYCGLMCGEYGLFVYKKDEKKQWKLYKTLWESKS